MAQEYTHVLQPDGSLVSSTTGLACLVESIDAHLVRVDHLLPQVIRFTLPKGDEIRVLARFSSHCWTESYFEDAHAGHCVFSDHKSPRVFAADRYQRSLGLSEFISELQGHKCLMTPSERNFMAYNASLRLADGSFYKVFFKAEKERGAIDNIRFSMSVTIESAYVSNDEDKGMKVKFNAIIDSVMKSRLIPYKP